MDEYIKEHLAQIDVWLEKNVNVYPEPKSVTLSSFEVDWEHFSGNFRVTLDSALMPEQFRFGLEANGKVQLYKPMFHSPLGAPCSYAAIDITAKTRDAITQGLLETFPPVKALGLDKSTGRTIEWTTPVEQRISSEILISTQDNINKEYSITVLIMTKKQ